MRAPKPRLVAHAALRSTLRAVPSPAFESAACAAPCAAPRVLIAECLEHSSPDVRHAAELAKQKLRDGAGDLADYDARSGARTTRHDPSLLVVGCTSCLPLRSRC